MMESFTIHPTSIKDSKKLENIQYFLDTTFYNIIKFKKNNEITREAIVDILTGYFKLTFPKDLNFSHVHCGYGNNTEEVMNKDSIIIDIYYLDNDNTKYTKMTLVRMNGQWVWNYEDF